MECNGIAGLASHVCSCNLRVSTLFHHYVFRRDICPSLLDFGSVWGPEFLSEHAADVVYWKLLIKDSIQASQIGLSLATSGCIAALIQIFVMPHVLRKFVAAKLYVFAMSAWPLAYSMLALLNFIARGSVGEDGVRSASMTAMLWAGIAVILGTSRIGCTAYS